MTLVTFSVLKRSSAGLDKVMNEDISPVLDAYTHALLGKFPRARYVIGKLASIFIFIQSLPEWLGDGILSLRSSGIKPAACR